MSSNICIVIINKNHGEMIARRLISLSIQTPPPNEIILIDDGSTDNSKKIINAFVNDYNNYFNIKYFSYTDSIGYAYRFNEVLHKTKERFIYGGASDDYFLKDFMIEMSKSINIYPNAIIHTSLPTMLEEKNKRIITNKSLTQHCFIESKDVLTTIKKYNFWIPGHCSIFDVDEAKKINNDLLKFKWHSDMFLVYTLAMKFGIAYIPKSLAIKTIGNESYANIGYNSNEQPLIKKLMLEELNKPYFTNIRNDLYTHISKLKG